MIFKQILKPHGHWQLLHNCFILCACILNGHFIHQWESLGLLQLVNRLRSRLFLMPFLPLYALRQAKGLEPCNNARLLTYVPTTKHSKREFSREIMIRSSTIKWEEITVNSKLVIKVTNRLQLAPFVQRLEKRAVCGRCKRLPLYHKVYSQLEFSFQTLSYCLFSILRS